MAECSVEGCTDYVSPLPGASALCRKHKQQVRRKGKIYNQEPFHNPQAKLAFIEAAARATADECIDWPWGFRGDGRPQIMFHGENVNPAHMVLVTMGQPRPAAPANNALHSCHREKCIAGPHLRWGTQSENAFDYLRRKGG